MSKKKVIEVALPLEAINKASAREKSIRHGHGVAVKFLAPARGVRDNHHSMPELTIRSSTPLQSKQAQ